MHTHIQLEEMTEAEYRNGGAQLEISYGFAESIFGPLIVAATAKGVCHLAFYDGTQEAALQTLQQRFPNARYQALLGRMQQHAIFLPVLADLFCNAQLKLLVQLLHLLL